VRYEIYGLALECDTPLPELPPSRRPSADLSVSLKGSAGGDRAWTWVREWTREDGSAWLRFGRRAARRGPAGDGADWLLRLPRLADFVVTDRARVIRARSAPGVPLRTLRHLLIDHIVPIVLSARGHLLLHASGIRTPHGAVLFTGASGSGKSTLAFLLEGGAWGALADDVVRLEVSDAGTIATPDYPGARLWPDVLARADAATRLPRVAHYSEKRRLRRAPIAADPGCTAPVARVLLIDGVSRSGGIELRPLTPQAAFVALVPQIYRLDADDGEVARAQFDALSRFCDAVPARTLAYPRRFDCLDDIRTIIAQDLRRTSHVARRT
jgi:hypothetical protein